MSDRERVVENLNRALHRLFEHRPDAVLLGQDVADPYGGAFGVTRGLSQAFPARVWNAPISESAIVGAATGLALAGRTAIAEIMFSDFATLGFDLLANFAAKLPTMYGRRIDVRMIVRTATGAGRGYGATHSQSLQKHFIGMPGLSVFEMSRYHDATTLFDAMLDTGGPCLFFEDKVLYTRRMAAPGPHGPLFTVSSAGPRPGITRLAVTGLPTPDCVLISAGGTAERTVQAAERLFYAHEICCEILVPARLHPLPADELVRLAATAARIFVVDEGTDGGTWGADVAHELTTRLWDRLSGPIQVICSARRVIPAAVHLERSVTVQADDIVGRVAAALSESGCEARS
jgi:pyruvate/2-oxoglutarate/acetoin dehydrogenase E1 component